MHNWPRRQINARSFSIKMNLIHCFGFQSFTSSSSTSLLPNCNRVLHKDFWFIITADYGLCAEIVHISHPCRLSVQQVILQFFHFIKPTRQVLHHPTGWFCNRTRGRREWKTNNIKAAAKCFLKLLFPHAALDIFCIVQERASQDEEKKERRKSWKLSFW